MWRPAWLLLLGAMVSCLSAGGAAEPAGGLGSLDPYVFVASRGASAVTVVDTRIDEITASIPLPEPPDQYVVSPETRMLVASHWSRRSLSMVSLDRAASTSLALDFEPRQIDLEPDGRRLAVSSGGAPGAVLLVSLEARRAVHRIRSIARPGDLMFGRDGKTLFVADQSVGRIFMVDVGTGEVAGRIELRDASGQLPGIVGLTRTIGGLIGFAFHGPGGEVSVVDLRSSKQVSTVRLPGPADTGYPTGANQYVVVPNERDRSVSLISTWTYQESARLPGAIDVSGVNVGMLDSVAMVLSREHDEAVVLDLGQRRQVGTIPLPSRPETGVTMDAGRKLYVALSGTDRLAVIDLAARRLVKTIDDVGDRPWGVSSTSALSYCH